MAQVFGGIGGLAAPVQEFPGVGMEAHDFGDMCMYSIVADEVEL